MDKIINAAHELGKLIGESELLLHYKEMEAAFASDDEAQKAVTVYDEKSRALSEEMRAQAMTPELLETYRSRMTENMQELNANKTAKEYLEAKSAFNRLIGQINDVLSHHIQGEEECGSCSGSCSGCSGCH